MPCTPAPPNQCPYQVSTAYTLRFLRYSSDKIFKLKVTTERSKVKSWSHHGIAHLHPLTNVPTKLSTSYTLRFLRYRPDKFFPAARPPAHPGTMGENNTPTALNGCGVTKNLLFTNLNIYKSKISKYFQILILCFIACFTFS